MTADRLKDGDFAFRATRTAGRSELACLGRALNALACALEERERARVDAEERLHNLAATLKRVEIVVSSISPSTVRITVLPVAGGTIPKDGALVAAAAGRTVTRVRAFGPPAPIRAGRVIVRFTSTPPTIHIDNAAREPVQRLTLDAASPAVSFLHGKGTLAGPRGRGSSS